MSSRVQTASGRLFVAIPIPADISAFLRAAMQRYSRHVRQEVPEKNWHLTLLFLGEVPDFREYLPALTQALPQLFMPTVTLTYVGAGKASGQLWAYALPTVPLRGVRETLRRHVAAHLPNNAAGRQQASFVPHIRLAALKKEAREAMLTDCLINRSFVVQEAYIYRSEFLPDRPPRYDKIGAISLMP